MFHLKFFQKLDPITVFFRMKHNVYIQFDILKSKLLPDFANQNCYTL